MAKGDIVFIVMHLRPAYEGDRDTGIIDGVYSTEKEAKLHMSRLPYCTVEIVECEVE